MVSSEGFYFRFFFFHPYPASTKLCVTLTNMYGITFVFGTGINRLSHMLGAIFVVMCIFTQLYGKKIWKSVFHTLTTKSLVNTCLIQIYYLKVHVSAISGIYWHDCDWNGVHMVPGTWCTCNPLIFVITF